MMHCEECCQNHKQDYVSASVSGDVYKVFTFGVTTEGEPSFTYTVKGMNSDNCSCECHDLCMGCDCEL